MKTSATTPLTKSIKQLCAASAAAVLIFGAATAKADFTIFSENFTGISNGTVVDNGVGHAYNCPGSGSAANGTFQGGKLTFSGSDDVLFDFGSDLFSHGTNHIKIEFDLTSYQQMDVLFAPGVADPNLGQDFNYGQIAGFEHGSDRLYNLSGGSFDYGSQQFTGVSNGMTNHWTFDLEKSGTNVTWFATFDANTLFAGGGTKTYTLNSPVGLNCAEFSPLGGAGTTIDNIVVTGVVAVPEPTSALLMVAGGVSLLARRRREIRK
ncbi:MAG: PEP-CTERM sorting domain-containing protein [Verrucomicrobiota bacterium]